MTTADYLDAGARRTMLRNGAAVGVGVYVLSSIWNIIDWAPPTLPTQVVTAAALATIWYVIPRVPVARLGLLAHVLIATIAFGQLGGVMTSALAPYGTTAVGPVLALLVPLFAALVISRRAALGWGLIVLSSWIATWTVQSRLHPDTPTTATIPTTVPLALMGLIGVVGTAMAFRKMLDSQTEELIGLTNSLEDRLAVRTAELDALAAARRAEQDQRHRERLASVGDLAAGVAHELNTPLQMVESNAEFLAGLVSDLCEVAATGPDVPHGPDLEFAAAESPAAIDEIRQSIARMHELTTALQSVAWMGNAKGDAQGDGQGIDLDMTAAALVRVLGARHGGLVNVSFSPSGNHPRIGLDPGDLHYLLGSMIDRFAGACPTACGAHRHIAIETTTTQTEALLRISDAGCDLRAEQIEAEFLGLDTVDAAASPLAQACALVASRNGSLQVSESPELGTTLTMTFSLLTSATTA